MVSHARGEGIGNQSRQSLFIQAPGRQSIQSRNRSFAGQTHLKPVERIKDLQTMKYKTQTEYDAPTVSSSSDCVVDYDIRSAPRRTVIQIRRSILQKLLHRLQDPRRILS